MANRLTVLTILGIALALAATLPLGASAADPTVAASALGDEGNLYQLVTGSYATLFPEDRTHPAEHRALALDVVRPDGARERTLVPGTEDPEVEGAPSVIFEDASQRLYAVWESKQTPTVSRLLLANFGPTGWAEPIEISGDVSPLKDAPRVLVTRDRFGLGSPAAEKATRSRTVIHVVWREEQPSGPGFFYTPVILEGGRYLGWNPVVALLDLEPGPAGPLRPEDSDLLRTPALAAGQDVHSVVIGFLSPASGHLVTVESRLLPGEIGFLADVLRGHVIEIGGRSREDFEVLADRLRGHIIEIGHRLNGGVVRHFADQVHAAVLGLHADDPDRPIEAIADDVRGHIIEIGASLFGGPGSNAQVGKRLEVSPLPSEQESDPPGSGADVSHLLRLRMVSDHPAPPLGDVAAHIFVSEDGERVLVGWASKGKVYYTESLAEPGPEGETWSAVNHMTLTERLGIPEAAAILEARVRRQR